jgi:glycosyltransferase involved in cell wall biosynthesis
LLVVGEGADWSIADDVRQLERIAAALDVRVGSGHWAAHIESQSVFYASQFSLLGRRWERRGNRLGVAYLHGRPGTPGVPEFDACYETVRRRREEIDRIQVSNRAMETLVLETGIAPEKLFCVPIGVDATCFRLRSAEDRLAARQVLGLPESAFVVGSFQKDGVGWKEGLEPKLIKGPDVLLAAVERLRGEVAELVVLLTGPARGYVKAGLERLGIPFRHVNLLDLDRVAEAFRSVDCCLVASRDEGGPKAVLQSMASGVPLVTTRVGQAADLVRQGQNGFLVEVGDGEALAAWAKHVATISAPELERLVAAGRRTAEENSYEALRLRWRELLEGFVAVGGEGEA